MSPFATLHADPKRQGLEVRKIYACANFNKLELEPLSEFVFGTTNKTPEYLANFPLGKVPGLSRGDFHLSESHAIARYLAGQGPAAKQLLGGTPEEQAKVLQFTFFTVAHLDTTLHKVGLWRFGFGPYKKEDEETGTKDMKRWLDYLEGELKKRTWLVDIQGESGPSLADLAIADKMYFNFKVYLDTDLRKDYPALVGWYNRLLTLPQTKDLYAVEMVEKRKMPEDTAE